MKHTSTGRELGGTFPIQRLRQHSTQLTRWTHDASKLDAKPPADLVQI
jgi:hypothetical protein